MRAHPLLALLTVVAGASASSGCKENLPEKIALQPNAASVEVLSEAPNQELYEPAGEVSARVIGTDAQEALRQAMNELRNKAASKGATLVAVDDVTSQAAWDMSGRTIVKLVGTAYKTK